jgi:hypothetical protein
MTSPVSPARRAKLLAPALPLVLSVLYGCTDAPSPLEPRAVPARPLALVAPVVMVANTDDAGPGSLRQAVADAPDGAIIQFDAPIAGGTISLLTGEIVIAKALTIEGPVPRGMTISGDLRSRVFTIRGAGDVVLRNLSIVNGREKFAGGVYVDGANLVLDHSLVANNEAAEVSGGGIYVGGGNLTVVNSTVTGNTSLSTGGGILASSAGVTIRNSTIAFNTAEDGGGIFLAGDALSVRNSIIANNIAVGASTAGVPNCVIKSAAVFSGRNISNDESCGPESATMIVANPGLKPLADNGGPTRTHGLVHGAAVDKGLQCSEATDQRYVVRNHGFSCDLGAYEFNDYGTVSLTLNPNVALNKQTGVATVTGTIKCSRSTSLLINVELSQTQKTSGKFTTIVKARSDANIPACGPTPSSWSTTVTPQSGKFESGAATATGRFEILSSEFVMPEVFAPVKLFHVK